MFVGTVKSVSQLADSTRPWMTGGVKEYPTIVDLDSLQGYELKPGMTAEARILVGELDNVLVVPVQAIAEHKGDFYAFVEEPGGIEPAKVKIGENNETHVQILDGLKEGEQVALDARLRAAAEFKLDEDKQGTEPSKPSTRWRRPRRNKPEPIRAGDFLAGNASKSTRPIRQIISMHRLYITIVLAMRNLTLHKLRVLLTVLGLDLRRRRRSSPCWRSPKGPASRPSARSPRWARPTSSSRSTKPADDVNPSKQQNNDSFIFKFGVTYQDFERIISTFPTVVGATPLREFRQNVRHLESGDRGPHRRGQPRLPQADRPADRGRAVPDRHRPLLRCQRGRAGGRGRREALPVWRPGRQVDPDRREPLSTGSSASRRTRRRRRGPGAAWPPRISTRTSTSP